MDTSQWPQGTGVVEGSSRPMVQERRARPPQKDQVVNCPRCNSTNTKFCYYNNYSLSQPRYFCKTCRRYWTEGGSLRNVPVGGGSRKNKRSSSSSSPPAINSSKKLTVLSAASHHQNPKIHEEGTQDLNLAYNYHPPNITTSSSSRGGFGSFMSMMMPIPDTNINNAVYASTGFPIMQDGFIKPTSSLNFSLEGFESSTAAAYENIGSLQEVVEEESGSGARLLFPVEELKQVPSTTANNELVVEKNNNIRGQAGESTGYWNGMLGGGGGNW